LEDQNQKQVHHYKKLVLQKPK